LHDWGLSCPSRKKRERLLKMLFKKSGKNDTFYFFVNLLFCCSQLQIFYYIRLRPGTGITRSIDKICEYRSRHYILYTSAVLLKATLPRNSRSFLSSFLN